ncbi:hypothetical protein GCM10010420_47940 [Streptomyces glaucosporus]|uniref:Uncharacterized protein n=1 Tax=Streptomyces glaucosporus TaxID=284044 RepID=A0ABP5VXP4_9ACTN
MPRRMRLLVRPGTVLRWHRDLVGTPTELIDEASEIAWHTRSTLWGTTTWNQNATAYTPLRFPGQYADPETGLHCNLHRYYDPATARYTTPDPLGLAPAPNPATYPHNPHTWTDPLGLSPYENKLPKQLEEELSQAERLGVTPVRPGSPEFDSIIGEGPIKWAVDESGNLAVVPKFIQGQEIYHPVITRGRPVLAAGEADIAGWNGSYWGVRLTNASGHFTPSDASLEVGRAAFERAGIIFDPASVRYWWQDE